MPIEQLSDEPPEALPGDGAAAPDARDGAPATAVPLSPRMTAVFGGLFGLATVASLVAVLVQIDRRAAPPGPAKAPAPVPAPASAAASAPAASATAPVHAPAPPRAAGPWRVAQAEGDETVRIVSARLERRGLIAALGAGGVSRAQAYRVLKAFAGVRRFDRPGKNDRFVAAVDRASGRVRAFEYETSKTEVWQAREREEGRLVGERLDLHVERRRVTAAVAVGDDLGQSVRAAGLDDDILDVLDDALEGRAQLSALHPGAGLRIVAQAETVLGELARYVEIEALEYRAAGSDGAPLRVYRFRTKKTSGYFDARGHQPYKGGWRSPVPFARVSSRFNMHRMHPILHVVMPHNGVDFAAPAGTPVYAASYGTVESVGDGGPAGNLVRIAHPGDVTTGYAHLQRFAPGLQPGHKVETRQLVGYVGSTGRSTGPHLHFIAKKKGVFIDPLTLRLDGERVLPKDEREEFDQARRALDDVLDAIALPAVASAPAPTASAAGADAGAAPGADAGGGPAVEGEDLEPLEDTRTW